MQTAPAIADFDRNAATALGHPQRHFVFRRAGLDRVLDEVDEHLLDLRRVEPAVALRQRFQHPKRQAVLEPPEQRLPGDRRRPWSRQLREPRVAVDEGREVRRPLLDRREHARKPRRASGAPASSCPECASDVIGASELLSSWAITRITFFQIATSCAAISRVSCLNSSRRCGWLFSVNGRLLTWKIFRLGAFRDREQCVRLAVDRVAQRLGGVLEQRLKLQPLDLAAGPEKLPCGNVAEDDRVVRVRQHAARAASSAPRYRAGARAGRG